MNQERPWLKPPRDGWVWVSLNLLEMVPEIGLDALGVYIMLKRYMNKDTGIAFPSYATLAKNLRLRKQRVIQAVKILERSGLISVTRQQRQNHGHQAPNKYKIFDAESRWLDSTPPRQGIIIEPLSGS